VELDSGRHRVSERSRRGPAGTTVAALTALVFTAGGLAVDNPAMLLCGLAGSTSVLLRRRLPWDLAVPGSLLVLVALATAAGLVAQAVGGDLLSRKDLLATCYLGTALAVLVAECRRRGGAARPTYFTWWIALAWIPAGVAAGLALLQSLSTRVTAAWALSGTDLAQHVVLLGEVQRAGALDYSSQGYPRGLHMLLALVGAPGAPSDQSELLVHDLRLVAAATWLSLAVMLVGGTALLLRMGSVLGVAPRLTALAATVFGLWVLLSNVVVQTLVYMGAAPTLLAVLAMWAVPVAAIEWKGRRRAGVLILVAAGATFLVAHLWQALVFVPACAAVIDLVGRGDRIHGLTRVFRERAQQGMILVAAGVSALAAPAMLGVLIAGGTELAAIPGEISRAPLEVLALGLVCLVWSLRRQPVALKALGGAVVGVLAAVAVLLKGADQGWDLTQYYPMKGLWFLTLILSPAAMLLAVVLAGRGVHFTMRIIDRLGSAAQVSRIVLGAAVFAAGFAFVLPPMVAVPSATAGAARGAWDQADAAVGIQQLDIVQTYSRRYQPAVTVPVAVGQSVVFDEYASYVVSKLMSFHTGQAQSHGRAPFVCADIAEVAGDREAVVVTKLDPVLLQALMREGGCGRTRVVQVPGGIRDAEILKAIPGSA
jgi:hypothetical protein